MFIEGEKIKKLTLRVLIVAFWIGVWEIISRIVGIEFLVPSVSSVMENLFSLLLTPDFWNIAFTSIYRIIIGFIAGVFLGSLLAVITASSDIALEFFRPILSIIRATPIVSFIILALVWIRGGNIPSFISFLMVMPIVWGNVHNGIKQTDIKLIQMAKIYEIPFWGVIKGIYFHSVLPYLGAAATTSMGLAWKAGIAAEVIATPRFSIGSAIHESKIYLETPALFAWSLVVIVLSVLLETGVSWILGKFLPEIRKIEKNEEKEYFSSSGKDYTVPSLEKIKSGKASNTGIKITGLSAEYEGEKIFEGLDFSLPETGCVFLAGPSGCGKTTFLDILSGLKKPESGKIEFSENNMKRMSYVFQEDRLLPWMNAIKNVEMVIPEKKRGNMPFEAKEVLSLMGLESDIHKYPGELSGGMKQRVNLARGIYFDAPVILLDEPFKGLDKKIRDRIIEILKEMKRHKLLVIVSHDYEDIKDLADDVLYPCKTKDKKH